MINGQKYMMNINKKNGFSLLEVIVSLLLVSGLALGIFSTISFSKRVSIQAEQRSVVVSLIQSRLNELKSIGSEDLEQRLSVAPAEALNSVVANKFTCNGIKTVSAGNKTKADAYCFEIKEFPSNGAYRMQGLVTAHVLEDPDDKLLKEVIVTANWTDWTSNRIRNESAVTVIYPAS